MKDERCGGGVSRSRCAHRLMQLSKAQNGALRAAPASLQLCYFDKEIREKSQFGKNFGKVIQLLLHIFNNATTLCWHCAYVRLISA
jgi:hypothetical protein